MALLFLDLDARRGWVVSATPRPLYPRERPGTHCTGGWVGLRAGLDECEKSRPHRDSTPGSKLLDLVQIYTNALFYAFLLFTNLHHYLNHALCLACLYF
jgi:hypothetical protein